MKRNNELKSSWFVLPYDLKKTSFKDGGPYRYPESFVKYMLEWFTKKGDRVFDPFAGLGTTLFVAQKMGRVGIGIEYDKERYQYIRNKLASPSKIIHADSKKLSTLNLPKCDFSLTSPPYMRFFDMEAPLTNYSQKGNYEQYLKSIRNVYAQLKSVMRKNAVIAVEVSNTFGNGRPMTPLAFDVAKEISKELFFERELIYCVKGKNLQKNSSNHSYVLLFRNRK